MKNKKLYYLIFLILIFTGIVLAIRLSANEDTGICKDGAGIKHGNPTAQMPTIECNN